MVNAKTIVSDWLGAIEARDAKRVLAGLADEIELRADGAERMALRKELLAPYLEGLHAYESVRIDREKLVVSGPDVACMVRARVKMGSTNLSILGEELPTANKELDLLAALFVRVNDAGKRQLRQVTRQ